MLSEGRHLIQSGINPNNLFLDDLEFLYVPQSESAFSGSQELGSIPTSWFKGAEKEMTEHKNGNYDVWDYKEGTLTTYANKDRATVLSSRKLEEGERKPHGKEEQI